MKKAKDINLQEQIKDYYDRKGGYWDSSPKYGSYAELLKGRLQEYRIRHILALANLQGHEKVLDLGSALGNIAYACATKCRSIVGIDYSKTAVKEADRILKTSPFNNIKFVCASAEKTKQPANAFDVVISADLFEHLYPQVYKNTLDECKRILKKGGRLVIWTPNPDHFLELLKKRNIFIKRDISHVDYKRKGPMVKDLLERDFKVLRAWYAPSHIPVLSFIEQILLPFIPFFRRRIYIVAVKE